MAEILHFGREVECFPLLRSRGYSIHRFDEAIDFSQLRRSRVDYDLVSLTEMESERFSSAATQAREVLLVPAVLFRMRTAIVGRELERRAAGPGTSDYDLEFSASEPEGVWLGALDDLVARGRRLRGAAERIVARSLELRQESEKATAS